MALYTVHVPEDASDPVRRADRTIFVREGVNLWAFVFGVLFLLWHRLWIAALVWAALACALASGVWVLHLSAASALALTGLMHLFVAVEGNDLRRWSLGRRRLQFADVVSGSEREEAELGFFARQPGETPSAPAAASRMVARPVTPAVIGMFPDEDGR